MDIRQHESYQALQALADNISSMPFVVSHSLTPEMRSAVLWAAILLAGSNRIWKVEEK